MRITVPILLCMAGLPWQPVADTQGEVDAAAEVQPGSAGEPGSENQMIADIERLENLNLLSDGLVAKARSGSAPAHEFRLEARMYRELLRQVMFDNRDRGASKQLPQPLLVEMVRMSALLHSAADCKTGHVIVCPTDLMQQLRSQQARVTQSLEMLRMTHR